MPIRGERQKEKGRNIRIQPCVLPQKKGGGYPPELGEQCCQVTVIRLRPVRHHQ